MKLRIRGNSLRLRLTQSEVGKLLEKGLVENQTDFGEGKSLIYCLRIADPAEKIRAFFENERIEILLPRATAENWVKSKEVSISGETESLKVLVEKDFVCLNVRAGEDDSDNFPHPQSGGICC